MAKILDIGLAVVIWATSELAWLLGICQSPDVRQMNQQKSKQYRWYLSNTDLTAYLCDKSRSSCPRWPGQSSWWAASAVTGSWSWLSWQLPTWEWSGHWEHEPQIERGGHCTQHRSTRKSGDTGGHRLLASANMMRTWVQRVLLIIQVKESSQVKSQDSTQLSSGFWFWEEVREQSKNLFNFQWSINEWRDIA